MVSKTNNFDLGVYSIHFVGGKSRIILFSPCFSSTAVCLLFFAPSIGLTTTVPLYAGKRLL